ncbi:hypothetical protein [Bradyrhizobium yuanmingense]|uniref:hypothetical protein n=1 Tax=Bradyrhizobium yuanmingense TaxID=108015 RepID=UPI00055C6C02|nr:hypothetical protein [Bradyrhizobium yuanmingense]
MTADRDGPANDRDADASRCDFHDAEAGLLQAAAGKDQRTRSSGNIELLRRNPAGYVASSHRQGAPHRPRRAISRPRRSLQSVPGRYMTREPVMPASSASTAPCKARQGNVTSVDLSLGPSRAR